MSEIRAVLFDLDGTLVDTAPDMANALNALLQQHGRVELPFSKIRPHVSHGATALVKLGFEIDEHNPSFSTLRQQYLDQYRSALDKDSKTFADMENVLQHLETQEKPWGVVTNKPAYLTEPLLRGLGLGARSACVVSGDTLPRRKPHPDPLLYACQMIKQSPENVVYVGDCLIIRQA